MIDLDIVTELLVNERVDRFLTRCALWTARERVNLSLVVRTCQGSRAQSLGEAIMVPCYEHFGPGPREIAMDVCGDLCRRLASCDREVDGIRLDAHRNDMVTDWNGSFLFAVKVGIERPTGGVT